MNKEDPYRQKTDQTRQRINRPAASETSNSVGLPPRSDIHRHGRKMSRRKINYPLLRILVLFFILLPITVFALYTYHDELFPGKNKQAIKEENGRFETISIEDSNEVDNTTQKDSDVMKDSNKDKDPDAQENPTEKGNEQGLDEATQTDAAVNENLQSSPAVTSENVGVNPSAENDSSPGNKPATTPEMKKHQVQPGETLYRIAINYYHSKSGVDIIKKENGLTSNEIYTGQVLNIPIK